MGDVRAIPFPRDHLCRLPQHRRSIERRNHHVHRHRSARQGMLRNVIREDSTHLLLRPHEEGLRTYAVADATMLLTQGKVQDFDSGAPSDDEVVS